MHKKLGQIILFQVKTTLVIVKVLNTPHNETCITIKNQPFKSLTVEVTCYSTRGIVITGDSLSFVNCDYIKLQLRNNINCLIVILFKYEEARHMYNGTICQYRQKSPMYFTLQYNFIGFISSY